MWRRGERLRPSSLERFARQQIDCRQAERYHALALVSEPERRFAELGAAYLADPTITEGTGFGSSPGLRVNGKIFAMLVRDELVAKLPKARVDELAASGAGVRFDLGHGRLMKEWASIPLGGDVDWGALASEALAFVNGGRT